MLSLFIGCASKDYSIWSKKYCKLERLEYQEVTDTVSVTKSGKIEFGVKANGKVILGDKINLDSVRANLDAGRKVFINQDTKRIVKVSEEFYEQYSNKRASLCQIITGVKEGIIQSKEGKIRAENEYLDLVRFFSGIDNESKKKNQD